ncbi:F-box protein At5g07670-like [Diospyros lotus]|uniref:F-box protein At5g07670-like n=1 Tax=Diospyros lotus TaxID=55363 RepID=UPI00224D07E9|nr:F-box protein At5g07670-like [Diospyros lotus]
MEPYALIEAWNGNSKLTKINLANGNGNGHGLAEAVNKHIEEECWERERGDTGSGRLHTKPCRLHRLKQSRRPSWSHLWLGNTHKAALNHVLFAMKTQLFHRSNPISLLSDELLLQILSRLPHSQRNSNFLVSKQWLNLQGRLVRSLKLLDWNFLVSGRLFLRFPNLTHIDLVHGSIISPRHSPILLTHKLVSFHVDSHLSPNGFAPENYASMLSVDQIDSGLKALACRYPNLRKLVVVNASEMGLLSVAEECPTLQELELHRCTDQVLRGIAAIQNLRILKLVANVDGFYYGSLVSDIGLTILAEGCGRLVKLELSGCEGSYEGMKAIGEGCEMLEELVLVNHRMDGGWLLALSFCRNLKTLRFQGCKRVDSGLGLDECLASCPLLERLILERCQLRDKGSLRALFLVCETVREIVFQDCWGLENDAFGIACICRGVKFLSLEGCSLLTTQGLASVLFSWKELQSLEVVSCQNIKDNEVTPALSALFSQLKELKWRPNTKSLLSSTLAGTGMGKKGSKYFKKY